MKMMKMGGATITVSVTPQSLLPSSPRCIPLPSPCIVIPSLSRISPLVHAVGSSSSRPRILCNSSSSPGGPGPGENDSRQVLDAFFLGKAVAEALTERIESTVGEFLSTIGRLQAEQQKQVQEFHASGLLTEPKIAVFFQEEVLERAKKAKEKAAKEAMEEQGLVPTENPSPIFASESYKVTAVSEVNGPAVTIQGEEAAGGEDLLSGVSTDQILDE